MWCGRQSVSQSHHPAFPCSALHSPHCRCCSRAPCKYVISCQGVPDPAWQPACRATFRGRNSRRTLNLVNERCRCRCRLSLPQPASAEGGGGGEGETVTHACRHTHIQTQHIPPSLVGHHVSHGYTHARTFLKVNKIRHDYVCASGHKINWLPTNPSMCTWSIADAIAP